MYSLIIILEIMVVQHEELLILKVEKINSDSDEKVNSDEIFDSEVKSNQKIQICDERKRRDLSHIKNVRV
jgi:hypothetical protein